MFLFYCVGNEQYMDLWKTKFGFEVKKGSSSSSAAGRPSTVSNIRVSTVQGPVSRLELVLCSVDSLRTQ